MSELKDLKTAEYQDLVNQGGVTVVDFWASHGAVIAYV